MSKLQERLLDEKGNVAVQPQAQQHHVCSLIRVKGVWLRELHFVENARSKFMIDSVILLVTKIRIQTPDKQKLRSCEPQLGRQKFRLHTPAAQSYSHASRPLYFQALVLHRAAAHIQYVTVCLTYVQWFRAFSSRRYLDETSTRPKVPKTSPKPGDRGPLDDLSCCRVSLEC